MINMNQILLGCMILQLSIFTFLCIVITLQFYIRCTGKMTILDGAPFNKITVDISKFSASTQTITHLEFFLKDSHKFRPVDNLPIIVTIQDKELPIAFSNQGPLPELLIKHGGIKSLTIKNINLFTDSKLAFSQSKKTTSKINVKLIEKWKREGKYC